MTVGPISGHSAVPGSAHDGLARWAVWVAAVVAILVPLTYAVLGVAWIVGGEDAVSDTVLGFVAAYVLLGGLAASFVAFVMGAVAWIRHQERAMLWLPLAVFPALFTTVVLVEALLIE